MSQTLPQHIFIIPDGNRRWAKPAGKSLPEAYAAGEAAMEAILKAALRRGIKYLTAWGASVSNLTDRSTLEAEILNRLYERAFTKLATDPEIHDRRVQIQVVGRWAELLTERAQAAIRKAIEATSGYDQHHLTILIGYSGIDEMTNAIEQITKEKLAKVTPEIIKSHLWTAKLPPVDLVIRTGGEPHWSAGALMWDIAEAQFYFTGAFWPDFSPARLDDALATYAERTRRFGR